jgi:hypothetical protein
LSNDIEAAAWATVPDLARTEENLRAMEARSSTLDGIATAEDARAQVFADVLANLQEGKPYPTDVGKRASQAYLKGLEAESEAMCIHQTVIGLRAIRDGLKATHTEVALESLSTVFEDFMTEVRAAVADLDGARTAEAAVMKGGKAPDAWRLLAVMVSRLKAIRDAQASILRLDGDSGGVARLRSEGYFEVRGINLDDVPSEHLTALKHGNYDLPYLIFLSTQTGAWVPGSYSEMRTESCIPEWGVPDGHGLPVSSAPREVPIPKPKPPVIPPHARAAHLDYSQPTPPNPTPTGAIPDPKPPVYDWR